MMRFAVRKVEKVATTAEALADDGGSWKEAKLQCT
jgi:hypothetical protein